MSDAFAVWLWEQLRDVVWVGIALSGVSSVILILISNFKSLFEGKQP